MRVLLLTDTHGRIEQINAFAAEYNAQACIHCGDIGLFDHESIRNLPVEELTKILRHSPVSEDEKIRFIFSAMESIELNQFEKYYEIVNFFKFATEERNFFTP